MRVISSAPASIGNVSVGFDILGAALSPIDGSQLGDRVIVEDSAAEFELKCGGKFVDKLPSDYKKNIVYDCYLEFKKSMEEKSLKVKNLVMTLEKNLPVGTGLGSSACSVVAALAALNEFHDNPFSEKEIMALVFPVPRLPLPAGLPLFQGQTGPREEMGRPAARHPSPLADAASLPLCHPLEALTGLFIRENAGSRPGLRWNLGQKMYLWRQT